MVVKYRNNTFKVVGRRTRQLGVSDQWGIGCCLKNDSQRRCSFRLEIRTNRPRLRVVDFWSDPNGFWKAIGGRRDEGPHTSFRNYQNIA